MLPLVSIAALSGACGGDDDDGGAIDGRADALSFDSPPVIDGIPAADATPTCAVPATYTSVTTPAGTFYANFDDNGSGAGDPIAGNDAQFVSATLQTAPTTDLLFVNLYEGIATFAAKGGGIQDFGSFKLPLAIDIGANPLEQDYDTCGTCISILHDVTIVDGSVETYQVQLVATDGTISFTSLPAAAADTFTATLEDVVLEQIDTSGNLVPGGCTTTVTGVEVSAVMAAP